MPTDDSTPTSTPSPGRNNRAWCSQHQVEPGECFHVHYPWAFRESVKELLGEGTTIQERKND